MPLAVAGSVVGTVDSLKPEADTPRDIFKEQSEEKLLEFFTQTSDGLDAFNSKLFGGQGDIDLDAVVQQAELSLGRSADSTVPAIARFFADGALLSDGVSAFESGFRSGFNNMKKDLVVSTLTQQGYFVWIDVGKDQAFCESVHGGHFIKSVSEGLLNSISLAMPTSLFTHSATLHDPKYPPKVTDLLFPDLLRK